MLNRVRELFFQVDPQGPLPLTGEPRRLSGRVRVDPDGHPVELDFAGRSLRLYPDCPLNGDRRAATDWILVDSDRYLHEVTGFLRIASGDTVVVGRGDETCQRLFKFSKNVMRRQVEIANDRGTLSLTPIDPGGRTLAHVVEDPEDLARPVACRIASLKAIRRIFGGPIEMMPAERALATLRSVNAILRDEAHRPRDGLGRPGGLLNLPDGPVPVVVGDLHARLDNLLKVLSENALLDSLRRGEANLVILGDAVHPDGEEDLTQMDTSLLMLDLICRLKIRFPRNVFYVHGNHDSFDECVGKAGVPQGLLFKNRARELRGRDYVEELAEFFESLPYVVRSKDFIACHAGPPRNRTALSDLVNIRSHQRLAEEIIWNRVRRPHHLGGYTKRHVKAFRTSLGVGEHTPFIVGHTPLSPDRTVWLDVGKIPDHHIVFSAHPRRLAVFVRAGDAFVPLVYSAEALLDLTNALNVSDREPDEIVV